MGGQTTQLIRILRDKATRVSAIDLAAEICVPGGHETRRRRVREWVRAARGRGERICADAEGYWMARSAAEWRAYLECKKSEARFEFKEVGEWTRAATDRGNEQGKLFEATGCSGVESFRR